MARRRTIELDEQARRALEAYRDHHEKAYVRERCAAILKVANGMSGHRVAREGLLKPRDPDTVYQWLNYYEAEGIAGLVAHQQGGNQRGSL